MRFEVLSGSTIIGHSELEHGDPPMGVAHGRFFPISAYETIKSDVLKTREGLSQDFLSLAIRSIDGETVIPIFIHIEDFSEEFNEILITACGIDSTQYKRLFPSQFAAYYGKLD